MLRSLWAWTVIVGVVLTCLPWLGFLAAITPRELTWSLGQKVYRTAFALFGVRVRLVGELPLDRAFILVGNHVNLLDPFVLCCALPRPATGLEKRENFRLPIYGWVMKRWGIIPITRGDTDAAKRDMGRAKEVLDARPAWVVVFPEGTRTRDGTLGPFKKGAAHLALSTGVPLVPFAQRGALGVMRTGSLRVSAGVVEFVLGEALTPKGDAATLTTELRRRVEALLS